MVVQFIKFCCAVLFLVLSSCNTDPSSPDTDRGTIAINDSISRWIRTGNDPILSSVTRLKLINKAAEAVQNVSNDSLKTIYLSGLSFGYFRLNDSLNFRKANKSILSIAATIPDSNALAEANWDLAVFFNTRNIMDSAYYHFGKAQELFKATGNSAFSGQLLYNMAVVQNDIKDYTGAEITAILAIEVLKPLKETDQALYSCYSTLGVVAKNLKEYDKAIEYHQRALGYLQNSAYKAQLVPSTLNNLGVVYLEKEEYDEAEIYFQKVLDIDSLYTNNTQLYAKATNNLGLCRLKSNPDSDPSGLFERAIKIQDSIRDLSEISRSLHSLAEYHLSNMDTVTALAKAGLAKDYAAMSNNNARLLETLQFLARLDKNKAQTYIHEYINLDDSLQQEERQIRNKFARIRFETDEFIAQNELLARQRQLWIGIAAGLLLLAVSAFVIINQRVQNQKLRYRQQQQEANQEIFNLMLSQKQKIEEGKQAEQKRISEELHDGVLGEMNGIRMVLLGLNRKTDDEAISVRSQAIEKLQVIQEEIRTISHELSDAAYQKFHNFMHSIQDIIKTIEASSDAHLVMDYDQHTDWDHLNADVKINLYRIVQECLMNCIKHARAKNISINFEASDEEIFITLADDGTGFDTTKSKKGIGHKNISSRIDKLNGSWNIDSRIGKGTQVFIRIPYKIVPGNAQVEEAINVF